MILVSSSGGPAAAGSVIGTLGEHHHEGLPDYRIIIWNKMMAYLFGHDIFFFAYLILRTYLQA